MVLNIIIFIFDLDVYNKPKLYAESEESEDVNCIPLKFCDYKGSI